MEIIEYGKLHILCDDNILLFNFVYLYYMYECFARMYICIALVSLVLLV